MRFDVPTYLGMLSAWLQVGTNDRHPTQAAVAVPHLLPRCKYLDKLAGRNNQVEVGRGWSLRAQAGLQLPSLVPFPLAFFFSQQPLFFSLCFLLFFFFLFSVFICSYLPPRQELSRRPTVSTASCLPARRRLTSTYREEMSSMTICTAHGARRTADTTRPSSRLCARVKQEHAKPSASTKSFSSPVRHLVGCRLRSIEKAYQILCSQQPATTLLIGDKSSSPHHGFVSQKQVGSSTALLMKTRRISSR